MSLALPLLDAMAPRSARAATANGLPQRMAFIYVPNGVYLPAWLPQSDGPNWELTPSLQPLAKVKPDLTLVSGLDRTFVGGTGVHAQCGACWLTSSPPSQALDGGFPTNTSLDQLIAREIGTSTLLPSLELSCNDHADNKETRYFESISWLGPGFAATVEKNPRSVFQRLFGRPGGDPAFRSVLDVVLQDAKGLRGRLGREDQSKLDEYLESVRATETRIQAAERVAATRKAPELPQPAGIPPHRGEYLRLMGDLMVLAFQQDLTRVATLVVDPERWDSPRMYHGVFDTPQNHHVLTHTKGEDAKERLAKIDRFHVEQFAYVVERLKGIREGEGTLLDQCAIVYGSGLSDGDVHSYKDLPVLIAGRAAGRLQPGRHLRYNGESPLANLWLTLAQAAGVKRERFADSTGPVKELSG